MHTIIPNKIAPSESLTHVLFYPDDVQKSTLWIKSKAFLPPPKNPDEVSFNRACYIPDDAQKELAKRIKRHSKPRCFLRMTSDSLDAALAKLANDRKEEGLPDFDETAYFKYSPIFDPDNPGEWPDNEEKIWGTGFNPAHVDLHYSSEYIKDNEANEFFLLLSAIMAAKASPFCEVLCEDAEDINHDEWCGETLCKLRQP